MNRSTTKVLILIGMMLAVPTLAFSDTLRDAPVGRAYLESTPWSFVTSWIRTTIRFYTDEIGRSRFVAWFWGVGEDVTLIGSGSYSINRMRVRIEPDHDREYHMLDDGYASDPVEVWSVPRQLEIWLDDTSFEYYEYLRILDPGEDDFAAFKYWNTNRPMKPGDEMLYEGTPMVLISQYGRTTADLSVRDGPGTSHAKVKLHDHGGRTYLPDGARIYVVGRTKDKEQVANWFNHWYLITVRTEHDHYMTSPEDLPLRKWVFAEFAEIGTN